MIQQLPKWRVVFRFSKTDSYTIYLYDNFLSNVVRKAAELHFASEPVGIYIDLEPATTSPQAENRSR